MNGGAVCDRVMDYASSYLDRRMSVPARAKYDQHLARCPSCRSELRLLRNVSRRAAALPIPPTPHGLADRVRAAARTSDTGRRESWSTMRAFAAVGVAAMTIIGAYFIGVRVGQRQGASVGEGPSEIAHVDRASRLVPAPVSAPRASSVSDRDTHALRAAQGLLADLALIDQVPPELRRALLQVQLDHFGLDDWARRRGDVAEFQPIANVLRHLEITLRDVPDDRHLADLHLADLQREARAGELWRSFEEARGLPAPVLGPLETDPNLRYLALDLGEKPGDELRDKLGDELGDELGEESRRSLGELMRLKDSWVHGHHLSVIRSLQESQPRSASMRSLGPSLPFVAGASFADAGLLRESQDMLDPFTADAHDWMQSMMDSFLDDVDRARGKLPRFERP